ncbi:MAG TPA: hypothetical protein VKD71_08955 [Gemmataceae bacterium]|nr:hypothetical protein [Gemmataceae bacterium]
MSATATLSNPTAARSPGSFLSRLPAIVEAPLRYVRAARCRRRRETLERDNRAARLALGEKMFAAGIDDGETCARIAATDQRLLRSSLTGGPRDLLMARRTALVLQLADAALENDAPLPGADEVFGHALTLKRAMEIESAALAD